MVELTAKDRLFILSVEAFDYMAQTGGSKSGGFLVLNIQKIRLEGGRTR